MNEKKYVTWSDIKEIVNKLDEDQLQQKIAYWGPDEEAGGFVQNIFIAQSDYINPSGEGIEMKNLYQEEINAAKDDPSYAQFAMSQEELDNEPVVILANTPVLELYK